MKNKYLSGRVERTPQTDLTTDRYEYLDLEQAEPNLGDPLVGPSSITAKPVPPGQQYIVVTTGVPGERYWIPNQGGIIPGSISVFNENTAGPAPEGLVGGLSSTTQLVFIGNAVSAEGFTLPITGSPAPNVNITISPPGNNGEVLFKELDDFATSTKLVFNSSVGILTIGNGLNVGSGGTIFTIKPTGLIGIGTINPTQELHIQGDLRLTGTVYDYTNQPGNTSDVLVKNLFGGLTWVNQLSLRAGAGGTYQNVQYHNSVGLVDGAATFVFDEVNNRVGLGSIQPRVTFDVLGISSFTGSTTIDNLKVGVATIGTLGVTGLTTTKDLDVTGIATIATLGVGGLTTTRNLQVTGIATIATLGVTGLTTTRNLEVIGVSTFNDKVNIKGDLGVTGLTTTKNLNVSGIATIGTLGVTGLTTTRNLQVIGVATIGNIKIDTNTVSTTTGNLNLDSILGTTQINDILYINDATQSTSKDNGSIYTEGGVGIEGNLNVGGIVKLATSGGITTTGGDLYVGGNLYTKEDFYLDEIYARYGEFRENLSVLGSIGIGTTNPLAKLDVRGDISGVTVIKASDNTTNITLTSGTLTTFAGDIKVTGNDIQSSSATALTLSGADVAVAGDLTVTGNDIKSSSATALTLSGADVAVAGDLTVTGNDIKSSSATAITLSGANVTIPGNLNVNGNVTLGDANTDTVTFTSRINSNVLPLTNDAYDLGSTDLRWKKVWATEFDGRVIGTADKSDSIKTVVTETNDLFYPTFVNSNNSSAAYEPLYTDGGIFYNPSTDLLSLTNLTVSGTSTFNGNVTLGNDINVDTVSFAATVSSHIIPSTNATSNSDANGKDLGGVSNNWRNVYAIEYTGKFKGQFDGTVTINPENSLSTNQHKITFVNSSQGVSSASTIFTSDNIVYYPSPPSGIVQTTLLGIGVQKPLRSISLANGLTFQFANSNAYRTIFWTSGTHYSGGDFYSTSDNPRANSSITGYGGNISANAYTEMSITTPYFGASGATTNYIRVSPTSVNLGHSSASTNYLSIDSDGAILSSTVAKFYTNGEIGYSPNAYKTWFKYNYPTTGFGINADNTDFYTSGTAGINAYVQARLTSAGNLGLRGSLTNSATLNDYAEYFEWEDGNPNDEDRIGLTVVLNNGKIRPSIESDNPLDIIGTVSGTAGIELGGGTFDWQGKYQRDAFGRLIYQDVEYVSWQYEKIIQYHAEDENGNVKDPDTKLENVSYKLTEIPADVVIPDDAEYKTFKEPIISADYNESQDYTPRSQRKEWACIGLLGQVRVKVGQVIGSRWIKMKDINENIEEWLIR